MSERIDEIVEQLKTLTLLEASELVKLKKHLVLMLQQVAVV